MCMYVGVCVAHLPIQCGTEMKRYSVCVYLYVCLFSYWTCTSSTQVCTSEISIVDAKHNLILYAYTLRITIRKIHAAISMTMRSSVFNCRNERRCCPRLRILPTESPMWTHVSQRADNKNWSLVRAQSQRSFRALLFMY